MALVTSPARVARAIELRNLAVDLIAARGVMSDAQDGGRSIKVMTYDGARVSVLYKTPRVALSGADAPPPFRPKGFMIEIWFDGQKTMSVHWDHEGPVEVVAFKPGEWENSIADRCPTETENRIAMDVPENRLRSLFPRTPRVAARSAGGDLPKKEY